MILFTNRQNTDATIVKLLKSLSIAADAEVIEHELAKHPDYPSLLAISDVLNTMKVEHSAHHITADELESEFCPFIAHTNVNGGEVLMVSSITEKGVTVSNEKWDDHLLSPVEFSNLFSGTILLIEGTGEPTDRKASLNTNTRVTLAAVGLLLLLVSGVIFNTAFIKHLTWASSLLLIFKTMGVAVSVLLLIQSIDSANPLVQRFCVAGTRANCNAILNSDAAKSFFGLSWSEIGFFYFAGTELLLLFGNLSPAILQTLFVLNAVSIPYTFYSIYYQAFVAKKWCVLCCTVQALLWTEFSTLLGIGIPGTVSPLHLNDISAIAIGLLLPLLGWLLLKPILVKLQQNIYLKQLRRFKYNNEVFKHFLERQPKYPNPAEEWSMVLGNKTADNILTIVTNPYCSPCAATHQLLHGWLQHNQNLQLRVVFATDSSEKDKSVVVARQLMSLYQRADTDLANEALHDWYAQKTKDYKTWATKYPVAISPESIMRLEKQKNWINIADVAGTPTLFLNGYLLPATYSLGDIKYMLT